jgi:hypothetical protein
VRSILQPYDCLGEDVARSIQQTSYGGNIVAGWTQSIGAGATDFWVLKLDADGNIAARPALGTGVNSNATVTTTTVAPPKSSPRSRIPPRP